MTEPSTSQDDRWLEAELRGLGRRLDYPLPDSVARSTGAALRARPLRSRRLPVSLFSRWTAIASAGAISVLVLLLALSPGARTAVASWLGVPGIRIEFGAANARPVGQRLHLGRLRPLSDIQSQVPFRMLLPRADDLGQPDAAYLAPPPPVGGRVSLVYRPRPGLPRAPQTGVGLLLTEFRASTDEVLMQKLVEQGTHVDTLVLDGAPAYWISGGPHFVLYRGPHGIFEDDMRLAANTLIWQRGDITLRLESMLSRANSLRLARSMREAG